MEKIGILTLLFSYVCYLEKELEIITTRGFNNQCTLFAVQSKSIASLSGIVLGVLATTGPVSKSSDAEPSKSSPESSYIGSALISFAYVWIARVISPCLAASRSQAF